MEQIVDESLSPGLGGNDAVKDLDLGRFVGVGVDLLGMEAAAIEHVAAQCIKSAGFSARPPVLATRGVLRAECLAGVIVGVIPLRRTPPGAQIVGGRPKGGAARSLEPRAGRVRARADWLRRLGCTE